VIHTLTSAEHRNPATPGCFLERPVRGIPDSTPRAPSVVSGARSTFIVRAALTCVRSIPSKAPTHVPVRPASSTSRLSTLETDYFGLVTPLRRPLAESSTALLLRFVLSRARTRGVPRYFQPTSATQSCLLSTSLHPRSRRSNTLPARTGHLRETRRFTPTNLLGRDRSIIGEVFARRCRFRSTPPDASIRDSSSCPSASQPNEHGLEPLRSLLRTRRDATFVSLTKRRLPLESIRAPASLRKGQALVPFGTFTQPVSNHGYVGGTPPR
jgi:hypothetical protein